MIWRHLCLVRAITAAGLLTCSSMGALASGELAETGPGPESSTQIQTETLKVLDGQKTGQLTVEVRGQGHDRVRVSLQNTTNKRLNVVLPPGLIASSAVGQGGGAGGGGGFQSMGLGTVTNQSGGFGQFVGNNNQPGFRSIDPVDPQGKAAVTVPAGQKVDVEIPSVCLNYGMPTPTPHNKFKLVDVEDYTKNVRVHKALRSLATLGTSHGTAQAAMWRVCNDVPFEVMVAGSQNTVNIHEVALASRFLDVLDQSSDNVDLAYLTEARLFVTIEGEGAVAKDAKRLALSIDGLRILGLPARVVASGESPKTLAPALHLGITLVAGPLGETRGRVVVQSTNGLGDATDWATLGQVAIKEPLAYSAIEASTVARSLDRALASAFVTAKVARRSSNNTTWKIENRLPFTLSSISVKSGASTGNSIVTFNGLGVGPGRNGLATIPAINGSIDHVELNGL